MIAKIISSVGRQTLAAWIFTLLVGFVALWPASGQAFVGEQRPVVWEAYTGDAHMGAVKSFIEKQRLPPQQIDHFLIENGYGRAIDIFRLRAGSDCDSDCRYLIFSEELGPVPIGLKCKFVTAGRATNLLADHDSYLAAEFLCDGEVVQIGVAKGHIWINAMEHAK